MFYTSVPPMILNPREPSTRTNNTSTSTSSAVYKSKANLKVNRLAGKIKSTQKRYIFGRVCLLTT